MEPMAVWPEVWPVVADEIGIWLVSGQDAWRPDLPVMADTEPHADVDLELYRQGATDVRLLHSTSWRVDGPRVILTYMAVLNTDGLARDQWPDALPISPKIPDAVGKPLTHAAAEVPTPRYIDVLMHGLRHLKFLLGPHGDATAAAALSEPWPTHLAPLAPALAGMYDQLHESA